MTQSDASTHRHDHNPFAIAHAINSIRRPTTPRETHATEQETTLLTAQRLHCLYQHLRQCQPMSPAQFHSRLTGDGNLVPFPLEYALYRIFVSPVSHSRASRNPELEAAFQYQQI